MSCWQYDAGLFCWPFGYCEAPAQVWGYMAVPGLEWLHSSSLGCRRGSSSYHSLHDWGWLWGQYQLISICMSIYSEFVVVKYFKHYFINNLQCTALKHILYWVCGKFWSWNTVRPKSVTTLDLIKLCLQHYSLIWTIEVVIYLTVVK